VSESPAQQIVRELQREQDRHDGGDLSARPAVDVARERGHVVVPIPNRDEHVHREVLAMVGHRPSTNGAYDLSNAAQPAERDQTTGRRKSQATRLVELAVEDELFHSPSGEAFVLFEADGHREVSAIRARAYRARLARRHYELEGGAPSAQAIQDAVAVLEGRALFENAEHSVGTRLAALDDAIYLDLADTEWRAVEVTAKGWRIVSESPVRFRRPKGMEALPEPQPGGSLEPLRSLVNLADADWPLFVGWLLAALRDHGPYPLLAFEAEQGTAKSTNARFARRLVDPNAADLRATPRNAHDLIIAASNAWVLAVDNVSSLQPWLSDALCRLATGGGLATRALYENAEETIFYAQRPALLTAIGGVASRGDLVDRTVTVETPRIPDHKRLTERVLWQRFEAIRAEALGALLDGVVRGLADIDSVDLTDPPRLADFAEWVCAAGPSVGISRHAFLDAYGDNRKLASSAVLDGSPVTRALLVVADEGFEGTASEMLSSLATVAEEGETRHDGWPRSPQAAGKLLARLAPNLRDAGYEVEHTRDGARRRWSIRKGAGANVTNVMHDTTDARPDGESDVSDVRDIPEPHISDWESAA
jgi:hypothetical protein